jgi:multidrug resistance efflux pump
MGRLLTRAEKAEVEVRRLNDKVAVLEQKLDTMAAHLSNARAEVESWRDQCDSIELLRKVYETANATVERYAAAIARAREALKRGRSVRYDTTGGPCSLTEAFNAGVDAALAPVNEALKEVS